MEKLVSVPVISFCKIFIPSHTVWCIIMLKLAVLTPWSRDFTDSSIVMDLNIHRSQGVGEGKVLTPTL
jgi:hypothetical protein